VQEFPVFPPGFGGAVFAVSNEETNQERVAQEERNTDRRAQRVDLENAEEDAADANAGGQCDIHRDLTDTFDMCDNQQVFKTPSANIEMERLILRSKHYVLVEEKLMHKNTKEELLQKYVS
jgi:hypothetical protein